MFAKFFSGVQEKGWYGQFLAPVVEEVSHGSRVLDVGTGSGKLLQLLYDQKRVVCTGVDTDRAMLHEAELKLEGRSANLMPITPGMPLPFDPKTFDYILICNLLFLLKEQEIGWLLDQALNLINKGGKVVILNPSGRGGFSKLIRTFSPFVHWTIYLWYGSTIHRARQWKHNNSLSDYCKRNGLLYRRKIVFGGFGVLEVIER